MQKSEKELIIMDSEISDLKVKLNSLLAIDSINSQEVLILSENLDILIAHYLLKK